jgi:outer membrane receptor protein involved in Fe transport
MVHVKSGFCLNSGVKRKARAALSVTPLLAAILMGGATAAYAADADAPAAPSDEVIVSGSRIQHDGFTAPTPTAVVNEDVLKANGTSAASVRTAP